jgi:chorismate synthase
MRISKDYPKHRSKVLVRDMLDYTYLQKYGVRDYRMVGVVFSAAQPRHGMAAVVAKKIPYRALWHLVRGYLAQLGSTPVAFKSWDQVQW